MSEALIDTDVLYKTVAYGLISQLIHIKPYGVESYLMLGAAKYMLQRKLTKRPPSRGSDIALAEFHQAIATHINALEPTPNEIAKAAELEFAAKQLNLSLDSGESLLCAILLNRQTDFIFTGDKRSIVAMSALTSSSPEIKLAGKVVCLEQLFMQMLLQVDPKDVRKAVCFEPTVDKALSNCFSCHSQNSNPNSWQEGLASYISSLNTNAPGILISK